jgi:hypothetical protein
VLHSLGISPMSFRLFRLLNYVILPEFDVEYRLKFLEFPEWRLSNCWLLKKDSVP